MTLVTAFACLEVLSHDFVLLGAGRFRLWLVLVGAAPLTCSYALMRTFLSRVASFCRCGLYRLRKV